MMPKKERWNYLFFIFIIVSTLFCFSSIARADIAVSGLGISLEVAPGETRTASFQVINLGEQPEEVKIYLGDFDRDIYGADRYFRAGTLSRSLARFIEFPHDRFILGGGKAQKVQITVAIPEAEKGPHWAMIFVEGEPQISAEATISKGLKLRRKIVLRYGIKVKQTNPTVSVKGGRITRLDVISSNPQNGPIKIELEFENISNAFLSPQGRVEFRDETGETVDQIRLQKFHILPGAKRILKLSYEGKLPAGQYIALAIVDFGGDYLVAGQRAFKKDL